MNENYIKKNNIGINDPSEINNEVSQVVLFSNEENKYLNCMDEIANIDDIEICNKGRESFYEKCGFTKIPYEYTGYGVIKEFNRKKVANERT